MSETSCDFYSTAYKKKNLDILDITWPIISES